MEIPYSTEIRADTGLTSPKLGIWLFLASEVMLFGSLLSSYVFLRSGASSWPDQSSVLNVPLALVNTLILLTSSVTIRLSRTSLEEEDAARFRRYMGVTLLLGVVFLGVKGVEYAEKLTAGLVPATNNFLALYYTLTGVHALHLVAGLVVNAFLLGPGSRMLKENPRRFRNRVELSAIYWHFVDAIWLTLLVFLYLS